MGDLRVVFARRAAAVLDAGDVGGEELNAVSVTVAAGSVVARGGACVDAEQVGQGAVVDAAGLSDLEEPVSSSRSRPGAGLIAMDLRRTGIDGRVGTDGPSMWANRKNPRTACIIVLTDEAINPALPSWGMQSSMWPRWTSTSGSSPLLSHQVTSAVAGRSIGRGCAGVPGQVGHRRRLRRRHRDRPRR
jgi:hypothetical protein